MTKYKSNYLQMVTIDINTILDLVAKEFGKNAKNTILYDNFGKHKLELTLILQKEHKCLNVLDIGGGMGINLLCLR